ncbi:UNVERIFIED_CONTAM: glycosyltransferase family 4 protein [Comamonas sp. A-3]|nr:glycosyltransferase family 1 protein [Comamonas thiooxydans]
MRIVIDLQGAQGDSRHRGIGRYSLSLAQAMVRNRGHHQIIIVLNGMFPESIESIRSAFDGLLPQEDIRVWNAVSPVHPLAPGSLWRRQAAKLMRESFLASLNPDIVHITSIFEGFGDDAVHSIGLVPQSMLTAVTLYDLIPFMQSDVYLKPNPIYEKFYKENLEYLKKCDLLLAISESSRKESIDYIDPDSEKSINISAASDNHFKKIEISELQKKSIRNKFGLTKPFLMYSGATDERKNHFRLIKAFSQLPFEFRNKYQLAIVGKLPNQHRDKFKEYAKICDLNSNDVVVTGLVTEDELVHLYNLCHLFVFPSWHEGFGLPALEAMACGAAVIGASTSSLPEVIGREDALFDPFDVNSISNKILHVLKEESFRNELSNHGLEYSKKFNWDKSAKLAITSFENCLAKNKKSKAPKKLFHEQQWIVEEVAKLSNPPENEEDWLAVAKAISQNSTVENKRLIVDISEISQRDAKSGVQRVVRSVLAELISNPPNGYKVEPVYALPGEIGYRCAKKFSANFLGKPNQFLEDERLEFFNGDIFFGLDLQHHVVINNSEFYQSLRQNGIPVYFLVHDLLPVLMPQFFHEGMESVHAKWLSILSKNDGVVCVSRTVADEFVEWLKVFGPKRKRPFKIGWSHNAADLAGSVPTKGFSKNADQVLSKISKSPTFLMVGTIEPRKGQLQTLQAFEKMWANGEDINLVMVGKHGWNVDLLVEIIRTHSELNKRLFWLEGISDEYLEKVYAASTCLIAASEGEGFGLPLIEAAQHQLPIIARDIPVFREVAGEHAFYFSGLTPDALADGVQAWLALDKAGEAPQSCSMPWLTWKQSTQNLMNVILGGQWYKQWMPDDVRRFWGGDARLATKVGRRSGQHIESTGLAGHLIFGPYIPLDAGQYQVLVRGAVGARGLAGARMDVAVNKGEYILGESVLSVPDEKGNFVRLLINLDTPCTDLEVRVWVSGDSELKVSMIEIAPWHSEQQEILTNSEYATDSITSEQPVKLVEMQEQAETQASNALSNRLENNEVILRNRGAVDARPLIVNYHSMPVSADKTINSEKIAVTDANENLSPDLQLSQSGLLEMSESKMLEIHTDKSKQSQSTSSVRHANKARRKKKR